METNLSTQQLEALLKERKAAEKKEKEKKRKQYEQERSDLVDYLGEFALNIEKAMQELKKEAFTLLPQHRQMMLDYGHLRRGELNKGSFEISNDKYKVQFISQTVKRFDERAQLAEAHLKKFMESFVKKKSLETYELLKSVLERNPKTGDYDIDLINRLYTMEDRFDDADWKAALTLFKEAYKPTGKAQYVKFSVKNTANNSWEALVLDFAKLKISDDAEQEPETTEA